MSTIINKKTKIVATVGPACNSLEILLELTKAGVDIFRLNFSHGNHKEHLQVLRWIRNINKKYKKHLCIIQDLQGPKIRVGEIKNNEVELITGKKIIITTNTLIGDSTKISTSYKSFAKDVKKGERIFIDDGKIQLQILTTDGISNVTAKIIHGGILKSRKGINLPYSDISVPLLNEKDKKDIKFGLKHNVEWIAISFIRSASDVLLIKEIIKKSKKNIKVIAKIEKPQAIKNIDEIIAVTDAVMVARGDLGVEMFLEEVPMLQKMIVKKCIKEAKPVIIATQMMESMITNPRPTRAETNDIANAIIDKADALMLSAETATGKYPVKTVLSMVKTIHSVESQADIFDEFNDLDHNSKTFYSDSVVWSACRLAKNTNAKAIIGMTVSGYTGFMIASHRPRASIFIFSKNKPLLNTLSLIWGVKGFYYDKFTSTDETFYDIVKILVMEKHLKKGDVIINTASMPIKERGRTNVIKLSVI